MLTGVKVALIGGDARQLEVINKCSELDASLVLIGFDNLQNKFSGISYTELTPDTLEDIDAVILPAVGTDDLGNVESIFSTSDLRLTEDHVGALPKHAKIFTGMAKNYLRSLCAQFDIELIELFNRDDVAIYNSIPTAEGAVMLAIQNTDFTIHGSYSMVLGFGRTGMTLARTLQGLGAKVRVGVNKPDYFARAWEMGFAPFYTQDLHAQVTNIDLLFNTIPTMIITAQIIANIPHRAVIIDLASRPGGTDFRFAEKRGIKAVLAPGLPGIVAPKTAGRIIADTLSRIILEDSGQRRNVE
ncbi:dipicolinate synthase subunit DpsA [Paenibacillus xerothermodurans]|uniref:Dipicolinate synthase subunit DpsA n=1 Tax=Paenibacillus xerothermodurans TaxID=1977292 RepID=A0A2W1P3V5_PAEXE|nr:dipicolinate synthase subunit DpsA [Paenibacillus xerothermodurans]PZE22402.1 dipicolinate synthase subunit DpsA [Paenibacillus xerothermodurans]